MSDYKSTITDTIIDKLRDNLPSDYFKEFYYGDPLSIPSECLPCVIVRTENTQITQGPTGVDLLTHTVVIQLAYDKRTEFGKSSTEVAGVRRLEEFAEARDPDTNQYDPRSVAGILRTNFTLGDIAVNQEVMIEYGLVGRPDGQITAECQITCAIEEHVPVPTRT